MAPSSAAAGENVTVSVVTSGLSGALADLFGRSGASNGCWCQYWLLGPEYHRRDRGLNRAALMDEAARSTPPGPGLLARSPDGTAVGWARLTPRAALPWLIARLGRHLPDGGRDDGVWSMPCFFVRSRWRSHGVMSALIAAGIGVATDHRLPVLEAYPIDPSVPGATRNRYTGVLPAFLQAGFAEVARPSNDRAVVRYEPSHACASGSGRSAR